MWSLQKRHVVGFQTYTSHDIQCVAEMSLVLPKEKAGFIAEM